MAEEGPVWAVGCMSGTSLDGVDAAEVLTDGLAVFEFGRTAYRPYSDTEREAIRRALGAWQGDCRVAEAEKAVLAAHLDILREFRREALVGFHGQTLAHDPNSGRTHQAGSGSDLAKACGRAVVWDFRSEDMRNGGQGAPLAPFFHHALARSAGAGGTVAFLNIGGVSNVTWIDADIERPEFPGALLAFDTGPGNSVLNDLVKENTGIEFDEGGSLAAGGTVSREIVTRFLECGYFSRTPPKSLDRDDFKFLVDEVSHLGVEDGCATLAECVCQGVAAGFRHFPRRPEAVAVCGGGRKNAALMKGLSEALGPAVRPVESFGFDGDMIEAQAFAFLAVRAFRGMPISAPATTGCRQPVVGGKRSAAP